ncbi:MAG TPA: hypothetical protein VD997_11875 [Phycisphaerales bacterium]|nr:hypothetical protein [Phycisphaerales bacterium]
MRTTTLATLAAMTLAAGSALADVVGNPLTITATTASGLSATWTLTPGMGEWSNNGQDWSFTSGSTWRREFWAGGQLLGGLSSLSMNLIGDPQVHVNFTTFGGSVPATFTFSSALLTFAPITGGTADASAGITLADIDGDALSYVNPTSPGNGIYRATFNGMDPAGTNYTSFFNSGFTASGLGGSTSDSFGPTTVPYSVSSMSAQFSFVLSPNDLASGTSQFRLVPTPGAAGVLGLGLLAVARRRR